MNITFEPETAHHVIEAFGWRTDADNRIVNAAGDPVRATDGRPLTLDEFGGVVDDACGEPTPLRADFPSIVDHVGQQRGSSDASNSTSEV